MTPPPQTLANLRSTLQTQAPDLWQHSVRVAELAYRIGWAVGLTPPARTALQDAGLCHDIGKLCLPARLWSARGPLTAADWTRVRQHPTCGAHALRTCGATELATIVEQHHERWDGRGYPTGRAGAAIHPTARILALADTLVTICNDRPYQDRRPYCVAVAVLTTEAGLQFDPALVARYLSLWPAHHPPVELLPLAQRRSF